MAFEPAQPDELSLVTLAHLTQAGPWQLSLAHDRGHHLLIWMTRGQGLALLDGARRGVGVHNALFVPARSLMSLEPGRQGYGTALLIPRDSALVLPKTPQHLRIREVTAQSELSGLMEALGREQTAQQPLVQAAMMAHAELVAIWLRRNIARQLEKSDQPDPPETAARRLSRAWCARLVGNYASPASMGDHAAAMGVTPTHLTRICRAQTGRTAARLLCERQLHAAHQLLIATKVPMLDIARHLGFGSAAYFTRFIRQHTGNTPTGLRQNARSSKTHPPSG